MWFVTTICSHSRKVEIIDKSKAIHKLCGYCVKFFKSRIKWFPKTLSLLAILDLSENILRHLFVLINGEGFGWDEFTRHSQILTDTDILVNRSNSPNTSPNTFLGKNMILSGNIWFYKTPFFRIKTITIVIRTIYKDFYFIRVLLQ